MVFASFALRLKGICDPVTVRMGSNHACKVPDKKENPPVLAG
jgi:hypothetical protein